MLSRIAEALYWMGRYLERADDTARLLDVYVHRMVVQVNDERVGASLLAAMGLGKAFKNIRAIFRERGKINAEVTGRLTESLAGVRVVKGYHAEATEARVFAGGVQRLDDAIVQVVAEADLALEFLVEELLL